MLVKSGKPRSSEDVPKLWSRHFTVLLVATIGVCLVTNMYNLGMTYYADLLKGDIRYAGVSAGVFSLASLVAKPIAGELSNRYDRCKITLAATVTIGIISYAHGATQSIPELAVARAFHGFAFALFSTAAAGEVNATLPRERLSEGLGFYSVSSALVPAIGPTIFLAVVDEGSIESFDEMFLLSGVDCALVAVFLIVGIPITFGLTRQFKHTRSSDGIRDSGSEAHLTIPDDAPKAYFGFETATFLPAAFLLLFAFVYAPVNFFLPEYAFSCGYGDVGLFYLLFAVASFASRFLVGKYADNHGPDGMLTLGIALCGLSYLAIPFSGGVVGLSIISVPYGIGMGIVSPLLNSYIVSRCSKYRPGSASAAYYAAYDIGYVFGSFLTGIAIAAIGYTALYVSCGVITFGGLIAFRLLLAGKYGQA